MRKKVSKKQRLDILRTLDFAEGRVGR